LSSIVISTGSFRNHVLPNAAKAFASFGLFFGGWWLLSRFTSIPGYLLPPPDHVFTTLVDLLTGRASGSNIWVDIGASLQRQLLGFGGAVLIGAPLGIACGYLGGWMVGVDRALRVIYPIPTFAWIPLVLIWFGPGGQAITFMVCMSAFWPIYMQAFAGTRQLSIRYLWVANALSATPASIAKSILLPGILPFLLNGLRLGYGEAWRLLVAAEILLATAGLGHMIQVSRSMLEISKIMAGMAVIGLLGLLVERFVFDRIEAATIRKWYRADPATNNA
jgi:ABC-type nitrate/sulfonate/bicarbonate transport system permease component